MIYSVLILGVLAMLNDSGGSMKRGSELMKVPRTSRKRMPWKQETKQHKEKCLSNSYMAVLSEMIRGPVV